MEIGYTLIYGDKINFAYIHLIDDKISNNLTKISKYYTEQYVSSIVIELFSSIYTLNPRKRSL